MSAKALSMLAIMVAAAAMTTYTLSTAVPREGLSGRLLTLQATIVEIGSSNITLTTGNRTGTLGTSGTWIYVKGDDIDLVGWEEASAYFGEGDKVSVTLVVVSRGDLRRPFLLKIQKGDLSIVRMPPRWLLRRFVAGTGRAGFKATVKSVKEEYIIAERNGHAMIVITKGDWTLAGDGEVSWSDVASSFHPGDQAWVYGRVVVFRKGLQGVRAVVWPRAMIDLTDGVSIVRS